MLAEAETDDAALHLISNPRQPAHGQIWQRQQPEVPPHQLNQTEKSCTGLISKVFR